MGRTIKLYHGSMYYFEHIDLSKCLDKKDFGRGFYMTANYEIAKGWALRHKIRNGADKAYIYMAKIDVDAMKTLLNVHEFKESIAWVDYIVYNRMHGIEDMGKYKDKDYDVVTGKIADGRAQLEVQRYCIGGSYTKEDKERLIKALSASDLKDQVCFKTLKAISFLEKSQPYGRLSVKVI